MIERPILFSGAMVRALLAGTKTQTRRVVKHPGLASLSYIVDCRDGWWGDEEGDFQALCPYGVPGDRLWVRETWAPHFIYEGVRPSEIKIDAGSCLFYKADGGIIGGCTESQRAPKWRPAIHMPRAASRITLEITAVRVERLQDISEADAIAEGVTLNLEPGARSRLRNPNGRREYRPAGSAYAELWEHINGWGSWDLNPWVWVVAFRPV